MTSVESPLDVVKRFTSNFEKKQRNLYKRKSKLDQYREKLNRGESLNEEQKKAVEGYDAVIQSIAIVHETLSQSKELADEVLKASDNVDAQKEAAQESSIVSYICIHNNLMRFLDSLSSQLVRSAVLKASSDNQLKMLDTVHELIKSPVIDDWSGSAASASYLQEHPRMLQSAQHSYNFVTGRQLPIPVPPEYDGSRKKFNFKEARSLCFRLLATPIVMRSMGCERQISVSSLYEEISHPIKESAISDLREADTQSPFVYEPLKTGQSAICPPKLEPAPLTQPGVVLDEVIKPLRGAFKFLQASSVIPPANQVEVKPTYIIPSEMPSAAASTYHEPKEPIIQSFDEEEDDDVVVVNDDGREANQSPHLDSYSCPPPRDMPKTDYLPPHDVHIHQPFMQQTHVTHHRPEQPDELMVEPSRPSKPLSYAELLRRPWGQQQQHSRQEQHTAKRQMLPTDNLHPPMISQSDHQQQQQQYHQQPAATFEKNPEREFTAPRGGGGRGGFRPPFPRGGRRPMGSFRGGRFGGGPGRGAYRDVQPIVAQPSY